MDENEIELMKQINDFLNPPMLKDLEFCSSEISNLAYKDYCQGFMSSHNIFEESDNWMIAYLYKLLGNLHNSLGDIELFEFPTSLPKWEAWGERDIDYHLANISAISLSWLYKRHRDEVRKNREKEE